MKINGKWYFNSSLTFDDFEITGNRMQEDVSFTSVDRSIEGDVQSTSCTNMIFEYVMYYEIYYGIDDGSGYCVYSDGYWFIDEARTIDFGAAYQEVSDEFYNLLTTNAVQLSKPIPMTHPKGIRLLTKGKKCTEDIEVVATFEMIYVETVEINVVCTSGRWVITILENGQIKNSVVEDGEIVQAVAGSYARSLKDDPDNTFSSYVDIKGKERSYVAITDEGNNDYVYQLDWDGTLKIK